MLFLALMVRTKVKLLAANQANMYNQQAASASAGVGSALGSGVNSYLSYNAMQNQNALLQNALSTKTTGLTTPTSFNDLF